MRVRRRVCYTHQRSVVVRMNLAAEHSLLVVFERSRTRAFSIRNAWLQKGSTVVSEPSLDSLIPDCVGAVRITT